MRFKIPGDLHNFFSKNNYLELEDVFLPDEITKISNSIDEELIKRSSANPYKGRRDLWRDSGCIAKVVCSHKFARLAAQIFNQKFLQLGFDQVLQKSTESNYLLETTYSMQDISCIKPLLGGIVIQLKGESLKVPFLPQKKENIVFIAPQIPLPWDLILQPLQSFLLIAYARPKALYLFEKKDPYTHNLKKLGYGFGDHLTDPIHPILLYE
jgi:hypothetical protein